MLSLMILNKDEQIQSLVNQLRASDPMTLATLQANTTSQHSSTSDEYLGMDDESEADRYEQFRSNPTALGEFSIIDLTDEDFTLSDIEKVALGMKD
jgi:hypothetical protein